MNRALVAALGTALLAAAEDPGRVLVVAQGAATADDGNPATAAAPLRTIGAAARQARAGDTVLVHAGVYREHIAPAASGEEGRPLTFRAASGERVVVRGSDEVSAWTPLPESPGVFATTVAALAPAEANPFLLALRVSPGEKPGELRLPARPAADAQRLPRTLGLLFAGGTPLREVGSEAAVTAVAMTWTVSADGTRLLANFGCSRLEDVPRPIEAAVRQRLLAPARRGLGWIRLSGFVFEHCANPGPFPQAGAVALRAGHHWLVEGCTVRHAKAIGLDIGNEHWRPDLLIDLPAAERRPATGHDNVIRGNTISDNGICGIAGIGHERSLVADNLVERNGWLDLDESEVAWAEWAGIKLHAAATVEGNLVRDNEGFGIWMDNIRGGRVTRNVVVNNKGVGIFAELGAGDIRIDTNLVALTRWAAPFYDGTGIYAHDVSGLTVAHNLVVGNAGAGIEARVVSGRTIEGRPVAADGTAVLNNVILANARVAVSLPAADVRAQGLRSDGNVLAGNREYHQGRDRGWEELCAVNRFALAFAYADVQARADAVRTAAGRPPLPAGWPRNPVLDLATWQGALGLDLHSREEPGALRVHVRARVPAVRIDHDGSLAGFRCPPVPGIDHDLMGAPMPAGAVRPGPFQDLPQGRREIVLPLPGARP